MILSIVAKIYFFIVDEIRSHLVLKSNRTVNLSPIWTAGAMHPYPPMPKVKPLKDATTDNNLDTQNKTTNETLIKNRFELLDI